MEDAVAGVRQGFGRIYNAPLVASWTFGEFVLESRDA